MGRLARGIRAGARSAFHRIEWTIDQDRFRENPLHRRRAGRDPRVVRQARSRFPRLTGDCFMQAPFWKTDGETPKITGGSRSRSGARLLQHPRHRVRGHSAGRQRQDRGCGADGNPAARSARSHGLAVEARRQNRFESDLPPAPLAQFIDQFPHEVFGINYDSGNSAALGYDSRERNSGLRAAHPQCACKGPAAWRHHRAARNRRGRSCQDHSADRAGAIS